MLFFQYRHLGGWRPALGASVLLIGALACTHSTRGGRTAGDAPQVSPLLKSNPEAADCPEQFPYAYSYTGITDEDLKTLFAVIWMDGQLRGQPPATNAHGPDAHDARCISSGGENAVNIANWCCR